MMLLSGMTLDHSTADRGVERWISSLVDSPAHPSASLANDGERMTRGGFGPISTESSRKSSHEWCSSKTCRASQLLQAKDSVAYAAGLIDGEGSVTIQRNEYRGTPQYALCLAVEMDIGKSSQSLNALAWLFGGRITVNRTPRKQGRHAGTACWRLHGTQAACALDTLLPFLQTKRGQAELAIALFQRESQRPTMKNGKRSWNPTRLEDWRDAYQELSNLNNRGDQPVKGSAVRVGDRWLVRVPANLFEEARWETFSGRWSPSGSIVNGTYSARRKRAPRTVGNGGSASGSPTATPRATSGWNTNPAFGENLVNQIQYWQTPNAANFGSSTGHDGRRVPFLAQQARMWSTPTVQDGKNTAGPSQFDRNSHPLNVQAALWATPRAEHDSGRHRGTADTLHSQIKSQWPTPTAAVADGSQIWADGRMGLQGIAIASTHQPGTTTPDGPPSRRVLNPRFAEMLMGWPPGWTQPCLPIDRTAFAQWETASCHSLRRLLGMSSPDEQVA
jgi:hypothetical protein